MAQRAHRVVAVPFEQLADGPWCQMLVTAVGEHHATTTTGPRADAVHIAHHHIEISTREVALVLVGYLKHRSRVSAMGAVAQFAGSAWGAVSTVTEGVIAALVVHPSIDRIQMIQVGVHGILISAPPTVGHRVLTVVAVADFTVVAALACTIGVLRGRVTVDNDISIAIGGFEFFPQVRISNPVVASDDFVQRAHQFLVCFTQSRVIVAIGYRSRRLQTYQGRHSERNDMKNLFHLVLKCYGLIDWLTDLIRLQIYKKTP